MRFSKIAFSLITIVTVFVVVFIGYGIWANVSARSVFNADGYVLGGEINEEKQTEFLINTAYADTVAGTVNFNNSEGDNTSVLRDSFVRLNGGEYLALDEGVLLDFQDLSDNFINNYYIPADMPIASSGDEYIAQTTAGTLTFGENLWKLSDTKYLILSPTLSIHFDTDDVRETTEYVQISITPDGVVQILTQDNIWSTISPECYIETAGGVLIYPIDQIVSNDNYNLSIAKLAIDADDNIILTEDELRRQVVPEITIEAVDGEDGEDGESGESGESGDEGEIGEEGEQGSQGEQGSGGGDGEVGGDGGAGSKGSTGGTSGDGADAGDNTAMTALPEIRITNWNLTATSLSGSFTVEDISSLLNISNQVAGSTAGYEPTVTIYDVATGQAYPCVNEDLDTKFEMPFNDGGTYEFELDPTLKLEPNKQYRLSVKAYYRLSDTDDRIYQREFIDRTFYTDSTGALITYDSATTTSITGQLTIGEAYRDGVSQVEIYLLTHAQNQNFTISSTDYKRKETVSVLSGTGQFVEGFTFDNVGAVSGTELSSDEHYIIRTVVVNKTGTELLTDQQLPAATIKVIPKIKTPGDTVEVTYNRVTGEMDVFRPQIEDPDGAVTNYTYTMYTYNSAGDLIDTTVKTINAETNGAVRFMTSGDNSYDFHVTMEYFDNEKTVIENLGTSERLSVVGGIMPRLVFDGASENEYSAWSGSLTLDLATDTTIKVDATHELKLTLIPDGLTGIAAQEYAIVFTGNGTEVTSPTIAGSPVMTGTISGLDADGVSSTDLKIGLVLTSLSKNTNYTIRVEGYLNLGDTASDTVYTEYIVGTQGFRTKTPTTIYANFSTGTGHNIDEVERKLTLSFDETEPTPLNDASEFAYSKEQLKNGRVVVDLFSGIGSSKTLMQQYVITEEAAIASLFTEEGLDIDQDDFGTLNLVPNAQYTLAISEIADASYSYEGQLGFYNTFDDIGGISSALIISGEQPPDLPTDPSGAVNYYPITNSNVHKYNGTYDKSLPDDALVGYLIHSDYDNAQRLATDVTYYIMEYGAFFDDIVPQGGNPGVNPLGPTGSAKLLEITLDVPGNSDVLPGIAVLFHEVHLKDSITAPELNDPTPILDSTGGNSAQYYVYNMPQPSGTDTALNSGMGRGYRYIFLNEISYGTNNRIYPNDVTDPGHVDNYGAGRENGLLIGGGVAYLLNSGMVEAPLISPVIYSYIDNTEYTSGNSRQGSVEVHYTYREQGDSNLIGNSTAITVNGNSVGTFKQSKLIDVEGDNIDGWYGSKFNFTIPAGETSTIIKPMVDIDNYIIDYKIIEEELDLKNADDYKELSLIEIPIEMNWGNEFALTNQVEIRMEEDYDNNIIRFYLSSTASSSGSSLLPNLYARSYALKLTFTEVTTGTPVPDYTTYQRLTLDTSDQYTATVKTGDVGMDKFLGKDFKVTASIIYDNGVQGWEILNTPDTYFGVQDIELQLNEEENIEEFALTSYWLSGTVPRGGLLEQTTTLTTEELREGVYDPTNEDWQPQRKRFDTRRLVNPYTERDRYMYPAANGVSTNTSASGSTLATSYAVPKGASEYGVFFQSGRDEGRMETLVPTLQSGTEWEYQSTQLGLESFAVTGLDQVGSSHVNVWMFEDEKEAREFNPNYPGTGVTATKFVIPSDGSYDDPTVYFGDNSLTGSTAYYFVFTTYDENTNEEIFLLMQGTDLPEKAILQVYTAGQINATSSQGFAYNVLDYYDKSLEMYFDITRYVGIQARYHIEDNNPTTPTVIMTHDDLVALGTGFIASYKEAELVQYNNRVFIRLTPNESRKLVPGETYQFVISFYEGDPDSGVAELNEERFSITIPPANGGFILNGSVVSENALNYTVRVANTEEIFMGRKDSSDANHGEYLVRLVQHGTEDTLVRATTDAYGLYSTNQVGTTGKVFKFINGEDLSGVELAPNTHYTLYVYAARDEDQNGKITIDGNEYKIENLFQNTGETTFETLVDAMWGSDLKATAAKARYENDILVGQLRIKTAEDGDELFIDTNAATIYRDDLDTLTLKLNNSYGLFEELGDPRINKIEWSVTGNTDAGQFVYIYDDTVGMTIPGTPPSWIEQNPSSFGGTDYLFDIPTQISRGDYNVIIRLYEDEAGTIPAATISRTVTG